MLLLWCTSGAQCEGNIYQTKLIKNPWMSTANHRLKSILSSQCQSNTVEYVEHSYTSTKLVDFNHPQCYQN